MAVCTDLTRKFFYSGKELPDPSREMSAELVLEHFANQYPKLQGGKIVEIATTETEIHFELRRRVGDHG